MVGLSGGFSRFTPLLPPQKKCSFRKVTLFFANFIKHPEQLNNFRLLISLVGKVGTPKKIPYQKCAGSSWLFVCTFF